MQENYSSNIDEDMDEASKEFSTPLLKFAAVATFLIMVIGICGNFLTVIALLKCPKVRNVAAAFIISLCVADLLFCMLVLPFSALRFIDGTWNHGDVLCKVIPFIQYGNIGVSLLCIGMITINRYVMIAHHTSYARIYKRHWIAAMITFCWVFAYGMQIPTLLGVWGKFDYDSKLKTCSIMNDRNGKSSKTALFIIAFVIPCIIIIACYTKIFWVVHESETRMKRHANKQNSIPNNLRSQTSTTAVGMSTTNVASDSSFSTDGKLEALQKQQPSRVKDQRETRAKRNEMRITKMVLAIFLSFVICYLPITIAKVADKDVEHPGFQIFSYIMLYLSACINPIIYVIMNKQYRKAYKTVLLCQPSKLLQNIGKTLGGSSVPEKWKDTALNQNHSRTMVSQISGVDQANTSLSSSQIPTIMEMTNTTSTTPTSTMSVKSQQELAQTPVLPTTMAPPLVTSVKNVEAANKLLPAQPPVYSEVIAISIPPASTPKRLIIKESNNRIALVGGDVILEEEEEVDLTAPPEMATPTLTTTTTITAQPSAEPTLRTYERPELPPKPAVLPREPSIYVNVQGIPKKNPYYGQNINAIPDNNIKISTAKLKIEKDSI